MAAWSPDESPTGSSLPPGRRGTRRGTSRGALGHLELVEQAQLFEELVGPLRLRRVHHAEGESHVDEDVVPHRGLGELLETGLLHGAAEIDAPHAQTVVLEDLEDFPGDRQAHQWRLPFWSIRAAIAACPRARPPSLGGTR